MLSHELQHGSAIVTPDGIGHPAGEDKARPAGEPVAARERLLCLVQRGRLWRHTARVTSECADGVGLAAPDVTQQVFGLVTESIEIGTDGKVTFHSSLQSTVCRLRSAGVPVDGRPKTEDCAYPRFRRALASASSSGVV